MYKIINKLQERLLNSIIGCIYQMMRAKEEETVDYDVIDEYNVMMIMGK